MWNRANNYYLTNGPGVFKEKEKKTVNRITTDQLLNSLQIIYENSKTGVILIKLAVLKVQSRIYLFA